MVRMSPFAPRKMKSSTLTIWLIMRRQGKLLCYAQRELPWRLPRTLADIRSVFVPP